MGYSDVMVQVTVVNPRSPVPTSSAQEARSRSSFVHVGCRAEDEPAAASMDTTPAIAPTRANLIRRLHDRPDDFAATKALQQLTAASGHAGLNDDSTAQDAIVRAGLSSVQRIRQSVTRRMR
jgi:hypothetical protein